METRPLKSAQSMTEDIPWQWINIQKNNKVIKGNTKTETKESSICEVAIMILWQNEHFCKAEM